MNNLREIWCCFVARMKSAGVVATALVALFVAYSYLDAYRWWIWRVEFQVVAGRVYEVTVPEQQRIVSSVNRQLERAKAVPPVHRDSKDDAKINQLEADLKAEERALEKQLNERARFAK